MTIWISSDHHFSHDNIIDFCERPFNNVETMDSVLIDTWNNYVGKNDLVYYLGDFTLGGYDVAKSYFSKLNGNVQVLKNVDHHDRRWIKNRCVDAIVTRSGRVGFLPPLYSFTWNEKFFVLCHFPMATWNKSHYDSICCHGHSHGTYQVRGNILDVGVDHVYELTGEFRPVNIDEIDDLIQQKEELLDAGFYSGR